MAGGSTPERGPHGHELGLSIDYLLSARGHDARLAHARLLAAEGDSTARMHGHAFATLALAQAWSMSPRSARGKRIEGGAARRHQPDREVPGSGGRLVLHARAVELGRETRSRSCWCRRCARRTARACAWIPT
jgi:acyl-coenzyme A thioesterase PaaI-like protein